MTTPWTEPEVRRWLQDQKAAMRRVEEERVRFLLQLTLEESLRTYLSLRHAHPVDGGNAEEPSRVVWKMRQVLERYGRGKRKRP